LQPLLHMRRDVLQLDHALTLADSKKSVSDVITTQVLADTLAEGLSLQPLLRMRRDLLQWDQALTLADR
jgi:hypothetical protein